MSDHTPGPWHVDTKYTRVTIVAASGLGVAFMSQTTAIGNATFADARLIAAAPTLLAACELALAFHSVDTEAFVARYGHGMTTKQLCARIRAAIDEAERREP